jgi:hypothetical protein
LLVCIGDRLTIELWAVMDEFSYQSNDDVVAMSRMTRYGLG